MAFGQLLPTFSAAGKSEYLKTRSPSTIPEPGECQDTENKRRLEDTVSSKVATSARVPQVPPVLSECAETLRCKVQNSNSLFKPLP